jgi:hypothetical protein
MGSMSSLRWTQSCQLLENPLSSGTLSNLSAGTNGSTNSEPYISLGIKVLGHGSKMHLVAVDVWQCLRLDGQFAE